MDRTQVQSYFFIERDEGLRDVLALVEGEPRLTTEGRIGPWPVAVPMVDMHTIGAGGGSIAWLDVGGMLQVGPQSACAAPGPACYGGGGQVPTVTDANLLLGRLQSDAFLGGEGEDSGRRDVVAEPDADRAGLVLVNVEREARHHLVQADDAVRGHPVLPALAHEGLGG